jgi:hypothetical protein
VSKSIAERFADFAVKMDFSTFSVVEIVSWLSKQSENRPVFTIDEVEAIARESAFRIAVNGEQTKGHFNWWQAKKAELLKGKV